MKSKPMTDSAIVQFLSRKLDDALNAEDGDIADVRIQNFNLYMGKPYGNERDGYSSIVTREALEAVEWALPSILRVFTSGDRVVSYEPVGPEDEQEAEQQTDIANHYILKENNGFIALHNWFKDCLMFPNGYIGLWVDEQRRTRFESYEGLSAQGLQQVLMSLAQKGEVEVVGQESNVEETEQGPIETYDIKVRVTWVDKKPRIEAVPGDEMLVDPDLVSVDLDEADFVCRRMKKTFSQLVREGKDPDELEKVGNSVDYDWADERTNRLFYEDENPDQEDEDDPSMRVFWVNDCYVHMDADGDGLSEFRHIEMIGDVIFENEETAYCPYIGMAAILIPHKHSGLSFIDVVKDIQEIKSTLWRQLLDNIYKLNVRRKYVGDAFISDEGGTLDVLLDNTSEFIPARDPMAINEEMVQPIVSDILPVIQGMNDMQNVRSGVAPNLSLDPNVLQQSTMGAFQNALSEASQRIEMVVRIFAETGMKKLFQKMHQVLREYIDMAKAVRIRGEWVEFNPTTWDERANVTVATGLGFNNKEQQVGLLFQLLQIQKEALSTGLANLPGIYNTLEELVESAGLGNAQAYFVDPNSQGFQPPQPQKDPYIEVEMAKIQAKTQTDMAELQSKQQEAQGKQQEMMVQMRLKMNEEQRRNQELIMQMRRLEAELADLAAARDMKVAQAVKTYEEAQGQDITNDQLRADPGLGAESGRESEKADAEAGS